MRHGSNYYWIHHNIGTDTIVQASQCIDLGWMCVVVFSYITHTSL